MTPAPFGRLLVIGAGLLGTSVALAVKRGWPGVRITAMDVVPRRHPAFNRCLKASSPLPRYDLAILACPLDAYRDWMRRLAERPAIPVTDVGSLKRGPMNTAAAMGLQEFVGGHPMAGGTRPGPHDARETLFDGRAWFLVPGAASPDSVAMVTALAEGCGARVVASTPEAHDAAVAAISHLPQLVANLLMVAVADAAGPAALLAAGPGLRDTTRLADSDFRMWLPIVTANADQLVPLLRDIAARATAAADTLSGNPGTIGELFAAANAARRQLEPPV